MTATGKRIGFVDYQLDNFHANHYLKLLRNELKERGFEIAGCQALEEESGREWAAKNEVPYYDQAEKLNDEVDFFMVLAPSNPETHLELCERVLPFGKPTYVDKTFAPDIETAEKIFALADRFKSPMQTTSALRYTNVQHYIRQLKDEKVLHMVSWGAGRSFEEYAIHPVELVISSMGHQTESLMRRGTGAQSQLLVNFQNGRTAVINVYVEGAQTPFAASVTTATATKLLPVENDFFLEFMVDQLDFFESGKPSIPREESLMVRKILDVSGRPEALKGFVSLG